MHLNESASMVIDTDIKELLDFGQNWAMHGQVSQMYIFLEKAVGLTLEKVRKTAHELGPLFENTLSKEAKDALTEVYDYANYIALVGYTNGMARLDRIGKHNPKIRINAGYQAQLQECSAGLETVMGLVEQISPSSELYEPASALIASLPPVTFSIYALRQVLQTLV